MSILGYASLKIHSSSLETRREEETRREKYSIDEERSIKVEEPDIIAPDLSRGGASLSRCVT
jgi:hypothetical protein